MTNASERARLNRRIRILPKPLSRELKRYRHKINAGTAIDARGVGRVFIPKGDSGFFEGEDVISLCHAFLDQAGVEADPPEDAPCME